MLDDTDIVHGEAGSLVFSEGGHANLGLTVRIFHSGTLTDGTIIGWLPPEGLYYLVEYHDLGVITLSSNDVRRGVEAFTHQVEAEEPLRVKIPRLSQHETQTPPLTLRPRPVTPNLMMSPSPVGLSYYSERQSIAESTTDATADCENISSVDAAALSSTADTVEARWIGHSIRRLTVTDEPRDAIVSDALPETTGSGSQLWRIRHNDGTVEVWPAALAKSCVARDI